MTRTWMPSLDASPGVLLPPGSNFDTAADTSHGSGNKAARGLLAAKEAEAYGRTSYTDRLQTYSVAASKEEDPACPGCAFPHTGVFTGPVDAEFERLVKEGVATVGLNVENVALSTKDALRVVALEGADAVNSLRFGPLVFQGSHGLKEVLAARGTWDAFGVVKNPIVFEDNAEALAEVLKTVAIRQLDLSQNDLAGGTSEALLSALIPNRTMETLNISGNAVLGEGGDDVGLFGLVKNNKFLTSLGLAHGGLTPEQVVAFCNALAASDTTTAPPEHEPFADPPNMAEDLPEYAPADDTADQDAEAVEKYKETVLKELEDAKAAEEEQKKAAAAAKAEDGEEGAGDADGGDEDRTEGGEAEAEEGESEAAAVTPQEAPVDSPPAEAAASPESVVEERVEVFRKQLAERHAFVEEERAARHEASAAEYHKCLSDLKAEEIDARNAARKAQMAREGAEAARMSGWSHLRELDLSYNTLKNAGAAAVAAMLRTDIPKTEDELAKEEEDRAAAKAAEEERLAKLKEEAEAAREAAEAAAAAAAEGEGGEDGEAAAAAETPPAEPAAEPAEPAAEEDGEKPVPVWEQPLEKTKKGFGGVEYLDVSQCEIGSKGLKALAGVLAGNNATVRVLHLAKNKFGVSKTTVPGEEEGETKRVEVGGKVTPGVAALADALRTNGTIGTLNLSANALGAANVGALADGLRENTQITALNLSSNRIGGGGALAPEGDNDLELIDAGLAKLADAIAARTAPPSLANAPVIRDLRLRNNMLSGAALTVLAPALGSALERLDLSYNGIDNDAMCTLAAGVKELAVLQDFNLAGNKFTAPGFLQLTSALEHCKKLKALDVSGTPCMNADAFAALLRLCGEMSLAEVRMVATAFDATDAQNFMSLMDMLKLPCLTTLDVGDNNFGKQELSRVLAAVNISSGVARLQSLSMWTTVRLIEKDWVDLVVNAQLAARQTPSLRSLELRPMPTPKVLAEVYVLERLLSVPGEMRSY